MSENDWKKLVIKIKKSKGIISRKYDLNMLPIKINFSEIDKHLDDIELKTENFYALRRYMKIRLIFIIIIVMMVLTAIILFAFQKIIPLGIVLFALSVCLFFLFRKIRSRYRKIFFKALHQQVHEMVTVINKNILINKGLYMVLNKNLSNFIIYAIPQDVSIYMKLNFMEENILKNLNNPDQQTINKNESVFISNKKSTYMNYMERGTVVINNIQNSRMVVYK
jgi:hypothetical protein